MDNIFSEIQKYINEKKELKSKKQEESNNNELAELQMLEAKLALLEQTEKELMEEEGNLAIILDEKQGQDIGE